MEAMERKVRSLIGFELRATDGSIGAVMDIYLDDQAWTIRYLVVKAGEWFSSKKVLLSTDVVGTPNETTTALPVTITRQQVRESPDVSSHLPVSTQIERCLKEHHGRMAALPHLLIEADSSCMTPAARMRNAPQTQEADELEGDSHLRSVNQLIGYDVCAADGKVGEVDDFLVEEGEWVIKAVVIRTGGWPLAKDIAIPPQAVVQVNFGDESVRISMAKDELGKPLFSSATKRDA
jgi:uncharacterized protein YrrD